MFESAHAIQVSTMWFLHIAQLSIPMYHVHTATAFQLMTSNLRLPRITGSSIQLFQKHFMQWKPGSDRNSSSVSSRSS